MFKRILKKQKITQNQLAEKLGISQQLISKWINGKCEPQLGMLQKLAEILNCSIEEIVNCFSSKNKGESDE